MSRQPPARDRIIAATLDLIARGGFGSLTISDIAGAANVSRQTLYNHYPDVDSIVVDAIGRHNRESLEQLESLLRVVDEPEAKLEQLVRHAVAIGADAHHAPGIERGLSAHARAALSEHDEAVDHCIEEILERGRRSGAFRPDLASDTDVVLIRHMLHGLTEQAAREPDRAAAIAAAGVRTLLASVVDGR